MAFSPDFEATQTAQDPTSFTLIDTSTGTDASIASRNVTLQLYDGTYMDATGAIVTTPTSIPFPLSDGSTKVFSDFLPIDYAESITLRWLDAGGIVLYELSRSFPFTENSWNFDYYLTQVLSSNRSLLQNTNYTSSRYDFQMFIIAAENAVTTGNDISGSQFMLDLDLQMQQNSQYYF